MYPRRDFLKYAGLGLTGSSLSGWFPAFAGEVAAAPTPRKKRHCILLWMTGGPSQIDTFDLKPGHENGGPFEEIPTNVDGIRISEHLPKLAADHMDRMAIVRGLSTTEGDHGRATYLMRTGHLPMGPVHYPTLGSLLSKELGDEADAVPHFVSISPYRVFNQAAFGPGFLGPKYGPLTVGAADRFQQQQEQTEELKVDDFEPSNRAQRRLELWRALQDEFLAKHPGGATKSQDIVYQRAVRLMQSQAGEAFKLDDEPDALRDRYGRSRFGQGCLMARRLVEAGVGFVEVSLGAFGGGSLGWDTHANNFETVKTLSGELDRAWSALMKDLDDRGLLESTTILWMGEFGRTPKINRAGGRDHFPGAWTCAFAGGGIKGGTVHGKTSADGMEVEEGKVGTGDVIATLCQALGIKPGTENHTELGRPIRLAEGKPIHEILA